MKYQERIQRLRAEKERQTLEKMERNPDYHRLIQYKFTSFWPIRQ